MKKTTLFSFFLSATIISVSAQSNYLASWEEWSDSSAYVKSQEPIMKETGPKSDSISRAYQSITAFMANDQYYVINNLGDYYLWFIDRYPSLFNAEPGEFHFYYLNRDNRKMCLFVSAFYNGKHFPIPFKITFEDQEIKKFKKSNSRRRLSEQEQFVQRTREAEADLIRSMGSNSSRVGGSSGAAKAPVKLKKVGSN